MAPVVFALLTMLGLGADVSARKMLEAMPTPKETSQSLLKGLTDGRLLVNLPGENQGAGINDEYLPFFKKDYIPAEDGSLLLELKDISGDTGSAVVADLAGCAAQCSKVDGCTAASYYIKGSEWPGKKNCWMKAADFKASSLSSCELPSDATDDADAVLLFRIDETCTDDKVKATEVVNDVSTGGGSGNSTASGSGTADDSMTGSGSDSGSNPTTGSGPSDQESGSETSGSGTETAASGSETTGTGTGSQAVASQNAAEQTTVTPPVSGASAVTSAWALSIVLGAVAMLV